MTTTNNPFTRFDNLYVNLDNVCYVDQTTPGQVLLYFIGTTQPVAIYMSWADFETTLEGPTDGNISS